VPISLFGVRRKRGIGEFVPLKESTRNAGRPVWRMRRRR
jgi:hypothetical protein